MVQMSHILVLSQPQFVQRQLCEAIGRGPAAGARWPFASWLKRRPASHG